MFICELCGNTVAHVDHADVCKSCASMTFKPVKQESPKKAIEDKDNQDFMLAYFGISQSQFEAVTHDNLADIVDSEFASWYKNDAKRVLWHEFRLNAFTKKGTMKKAVEKKINDSLAKIEVAAKEVEVVKVSQEVKAEQKKSIRSDRDQYALDKAAEHRATAKLLGASALSGSPKQKAWAEQIRTCFIEETESELVLHEIINNTKAQHSDFWISLRDCDYNDIVKVLAGVLNYDRFKAQASYIRACKESIEKYGRENRSVAFQINDVKERYGVEL